MATIDFRNVDNANRTLTGAAGTSHTIKPNGKAAAVYYRDAQGGFFKDADGSNVPYDPDTWTRVWGKDPNSQLTVSGDITVTPAASTDAYARQE